MYLVHKEPDLFTSDCIVLLIKCIFDTSQFILHLLFPSFIVQFAFVSLFYFISFTIPSSISFCCFFFLPSFLKGCLPVVVLIRLWFHYLPIFYLYSHFPLICLAVSFLFSFVAVVYVFYLL